MYLVPVIQQGVFQDHALGQIEGHTGRLVTEGEQPQLAAQLAVVAALGLLNPLEIGVQLILLLEAGAVDALKHLVVGVAAPVGAGAACQLDGVALDPAGAVQMGTGAEIGELALPVEADDRVLGRSLISWTL
jgi:uncharacterized membrane protein